MKKLLLICLLYFITSLSMAQTTTWCPPGAQWHYGFHNFYVDGYTELSYVSDTVVMGTACHKLIEHSRYLYSQNGVIYNDYNPWFTFESGGVVFAFNSPGNTWDTLFNFNAVPNETWTIFPLDSTYYVQVMDTGHNIIQGLNLKWLTVTYHSGNPTFVPDTIYERIGCIGYNYPFGASVGSTDPDTWGFCNYSDSSFTAWKVPDSSCTIVPTGIDEQVISSVAIVFPNPVTTVMNVIINNPGNCEISLYDVTGRIVLQQPLSKTTSINTADIPKGIYMYEIKNNSGSNKNVIKKGEVIKQ